MGLSAITIWAQVVENGGKVVFSQASTADPVVVYGHSAAFVTGGGWFTSPPGAFAADPSLTGKATINRTIKEPGSSQDHNTLKCI